MKNTGAFHRAADTRRALEGSHESHHSPSRCTPGIRECRRGPAVPGHAGSRSTRARPRRGSRTRSSASSSTGACTRCRPTRRCCPASSPTPSGTGTRSTGGKGPKPSPIQSGTWDYHRQQYGADFDYKDFAPLFRAELFDADHWADVFLRSGAKYVVPTSKHHEGFALWPSREASATWGRPWNAVEIGPKRDLLGELSKAVRAKGLKMGFYYSLYEWYNPLWLTDKPRYVAEHMFPQFKDVVTRYEPSIIFSDGEWDLTSAEWRSPELLAWLFNESTVKNEVVVNDRWGKDSRHKHGGYWTTEYTPGMADTAHPWEESRGMGFSYGYNRAERLEHYRTGRELVTVLVDIVSRGGNLLLDIGPDADGTIPVIMEQRLAEIGAWLAVNGEAIYGTRPFTVSKQWSDGEQPKIDYNKEYDSSYDVAKLTGTPAPGKGLHRSLLHEKGQRRLRDPHTLAGQAVHLEGRRRADAQDRHAAWRTGNASLCENRHGDHDRPAGSSGGAAFPAALGSETLAVAVSCFLC